MIVKERMATVRDYLCCKFNDTCSVVHAPDGSFLAFMISFAILPVLAVCPSLAKGLMAVAVSIVANRLKVNSLLCISTRNGNLISKIGR